ncbi:hypothetical protein ZIOFF_017894 [Zingiber officinale]|uniref:Pectinesterase catalytic domain-containing protein n=1 Tax=Zingiber officinale TaxID=94328 RepID=A0A8J5HK98_ZINOF|nr:hypothetical protein ZIOFF_017894 [Zingiber officinale]
MVWNSADLCIFYRCSFLGYQDTLCQFYRDCDAYGSVDFIFGNAATIFQNCNLYTCLPLHDQSNVVTTRGCTMPNSPQGSPSTTARCAAPPWKAYLCTVIMHSFINDAVDPMEWLEWSGAFALCTLYYDEFQKLCQEGSKEDEMPHDRRRHRLRGAYHAMVIEANA